MFSTFLEWQLLTSTTKKDPVKDTRPYNKRSAGRMHSANDIFHSQVISGQFKTQINTCTDCNSLET